MFALELYNFFSALGREEYSEGVVKEIKHFLSSIQNYRDTYGLPTLNSRPNKRSEGNGSGRGAAEQLETHGYVVIPDVIEDKGGWMELLIPV